MCLCVCVCVIVLRGVANQCDRAQDVVAGRHHGFLRPKIFFACSRLQAIGLWSSNRGPVILAADATQLFHLQAPIILSMLKTSPRRNMW